MTGEERARRIARGREFYEAAVCALRRSEPVQALAGSTVVVVGASGLIGHVAVRALSDGDGSRCQVWGVARRPVALPTGAHFISGSATDEATYRRLPRPDFVVYIAGTTSDYRERPMETVALATEGLARCLEYAAGARGVVVVSSTRVYGAHLDDVTIAEDTKALVDPMDVNNLYDCSKRLSESLALHAFTARGTPISVARLTNVYGPPTPRSGGGFLSQIVERFVNDQRVRMRGHPESTRNYCFVTDAVYGLLAAAAFGQRGTAYNVGSHQHLSNSELMHLVRSALPFETTLEMTEGAANAPRSAVRISVERAGAELGFRPRADVHVCLPFAVEETLRLLSTRGSNRGGLDA